MPSETGGDKFGMSQAKRGYHGAVPPPDLSALPESDRASVEAAVQAILNGGGENVKGIALVGEAVPPRRHAGPARLRLVVLLAHTHVATLTNLGRNLPPGVELSLYATNELPRAADVFALELAEQRTRHVLLHGRVPYDHVPITSRLLRLAIERELRVGIRALRANLWGEPPQLTARLEEVLRRLAIVAYQLPPVMGAVGLEGKDADEAALLRDLCARAEVDDGWVAAWEAHRKGEALASPVSIAGDVLTLLEETVALVDAYGAADGMASGPGDSLLD